MKNKQLEKELQSLKEQITSLKENEKNRNLRVKRGFKYSLIFALCTFSLYGLAVIAQLHIFTAGETISAQKINENFAYLESKISGGGGGGTSGITVNRVTSYQNINLGASDDNTLIVAEAPVDINLPDISSVNPGYLVRIKQLNLGQFRIYPFGSDEIDGSSLDMYMQNDTSGVAILTLVSDGVSWSKLLKVGTIYNADFSTAATSCNDGEGVGATNCYNDSTAQIAKHAFLADNYYVKWDGTSWSIPTDYYYLINDSSSTINQVYTKFYQFASGPSVGVAGNGLYYFEIPSLTSSIGMGITGSQYSNHNNSSNVDYVNIFFDPTNSYNHCNKIGPGWRFPRRSETSASDPTNGIPGHTSGSNTWTATPDSGTSNQYWAWNTTNTDFSNTEGTYNYIVCVNDTAP